MREAVKVLCVVIFMFAAPVAAVAWFDDRPTPTIQILRYVCPIFSIAGIAGFLKIHSRKDTVPDYLWNECGKYFNRDGFCFAFRASKAERVCYLETYFQNQHDKECVGQIALRPARGFFLGRPKMETIIIRFECGPAAFGIAKIALPVPAKLQGKRQLFEVGASVAYPNGKGCRLRFHDGMTLRYNSDFGNAFGTALAVAGAFAGKIVLLSVLLSLATTTVDLPKGVAEDVPSEPIPEITTLWKLGDAPLQAR